MYICGAIKNDSEKFPVYHVGTFIYNERFDVNVYNVSTGEEREKEKNIK